MQQNNISNYFLLLSLVLSLIIIFRTNVIVLHIERVSYWDLDRLTLTQAYKIALWTSCITIICFTIVVSH